MKRKLGFAKDETGKIIPVESLKNKHLGKYYCPSCNGLVIPKMGKEKVWHFSHKGADCTIKLKSPTLTATSFEPKTLNDFSSETMSLSEMDMNFDPNIITCAVCKISTNKMLAIEIKKATFLCKECFSRFDKRTLDELNNV